MATAVPVGAAGLVTACERWPVMTLRACWLSPPMPLARPSGSRGPTSRTARRHSWRLAIGTPVGPSGPPPPSRPRERSGGHDTAPGCLFDVSGRRTVRLAELSAFCRRAHHVCVPSGIMRRSTTAAIGASRMTASPPSRNGARRPATRPMNPPASDPKESPPQASIR